VPRAPATTERRGSLQTIPAKSMVCPPERDLNMLARKHSHQILQEEMTFAPTFETLTLTCQ